MQEIHRTVPVARRSTASGGSAIEAYDIRVDEVPLLTGSAELRLGRQIDAASRRLGSFLLRHPAGINAHIDRLDAASRGMQRVVAWGTDRTLMSQVCESARATLKRASSLDRVRGLLERYPLEPEIALALGHEIARLPERSPDGRRIAAVIAHASSRVCALRDRLTRPNARLVLHEALKIRSYGCPASDLFQDGFIGLQKAALRFDAQRGLRFSTYAMFWIRQSIRQALTKRSRLIRVPERTQNSFRRWETGRESTLDETEANRVARLMHQTLLFSSFSTGEDDGPNGFEPAMAAAPDNSRAQLPKLISVLLKRLGDRERHILNRRFGLDGQPRQTLEDLGRDMGLSRERVRQLERGVLDELRSELPLAEAYEDLLIAG